MAKQLGLFGADTEPDRGIDPQRLPVPPKHGPERIRFGTSSWTYPGWQGLVYRDVRSYGARFQQCSLGEYARDPRFRTVGADNLYYAAPRERVSMLERLRRLLDAVPGFDVCPKVWHGITVSRYSRQQQVRWRLTSPLNRYFLDAEAFLAEVLEPLRGTLGPHLGPLILEVQDNDLSAEAFATALDRFLGAARTRAEFRLGVELRTLGHFTPRYVDILAAHGVVHVLNAWTRMPPIGWQHERVLTRLRDAHLWLVRALLRPGQLVRGVLQPGSRYEEAVEAFEPYDRLHLRLPDVREDILRVIRAAAPEADVYLLINNRLEGCAPRTIEELEHQLWGETPRSGAEPAQPRQPPP